MTKSRRRAPIVAGLLVLAAIVAATARAETPGGVFVMAKALDDLITLDPAEVFEFSGAEVIANLYQRLFRPNPDDPSQPIPEVAESWRTSADGRTFTFTVRDGLSFASGNPVTAQDIVFSLRRAVALNHTAGSSTPLTPRSPRPGWRGLRGPRSRLPSGRRA